MDGSLNFSFDGRTSQEMGVVLININGGMQESPFLSVQEIVSESIFGRDTPIVYGRKRMPLKFTLMIAGIGDNFWTFENRSEIGRWLSPNKFAEFFITDDSDFFDKRWFLCRTGEAKLTHNTMNDGYITIEMTNISCYTYSPVQELEFDFSTISNTSATFQIPNWGENLNPQQVKIVKVGSGNLSIKNMSDGEREFKFIGLLDNEALTIDCELRRIDTSIDGTSRYDSFNGNYLKFVYGMNTMQVTGACTIEFKHRYIFLG